MSRTRMLRFESEEAFAAERAARRERFQVGAVHTLERDVLAACAELLQRHPRVAFAHRQNTGCGYVLDAKTYHALVAAGHLRPGSARFLRFSFKGCSDILGMLRGGRKLAVECKSDSGKATDEQTAFLDAVNHGGGLGILARSADELARELARA